MNLAFLLHLYQPPTQSDGSFRAITQDCYNPLIKLIRSHPHAHFTLNCPLSLLEQFDRLGYAEILKSLKDLGDSEKVEYTGSAAYHCLLPKVSRNMSEKQVMLNEYGLGYYLGQRTGFEGENSVMVKGIKGFFPPEMAVNPDVIKDISSLGYEWLVADETCLEQSVLSSMDFKAPSVYHTGLADIKLIVRDTAISNMISFKRDSETSDVVDYLKFLRDKGTECVVVALDGEVFGHHNPDGIYFLENLLDNLSELDINVTSVSDIAQSCSMKPMETIKEATWSSTNGDTVEDIYPFWEAKGNKIQKQLWALLTLIDNFYNKLQIPKIPEGYENVAVWKSADLAKVSDPEVRDFLAMEVQVFKSVQSDQFWWASGKRVYDKVLYSPTMVKNALDIYKNIAAYTLASDISAEITKKIDSIQALLAAQ